MMGMLVFAAALSLSLSVSATQPQSVTIQVGGTSSSPGGITQFTPNVVVAAVGTVVSFQFTGFPGNHSVTQSSFDGPCEPLAGGFDSGWISVPESLSPPPEWNLTVTDNSKPIWFYCKQLLKAPHCNAGMVGVINVQASDKTFAAFQAGAKGATNVPPGQVEGGFVGIGASATGAPFIPSGAVYFNPNLAATQPVTISLTDTANGASATGTAPPNAAHATQVDSRALIAVTVASITVRMISVVMG